VAAFLFLCGLHPVFASADVQTIGFESGALNAPLDGQGDISFPSALGFRPYRLDVGAARAHSGSGVGDLTRCAEEAEAKGENPGGCEFFQASTTATLARSANSVSVFAGLLHAPEPGRPQGAVLIARGPNGELLDRDGPITLDTNFRTPLEVRSATGQIATVTLESVRGESGDQPNANLGIDDLSVEFADGGEPDFSVSTTSQVIPLVQGQDAQLPVQIGRLNGSNGPVELSVAGLPEGVSAAPVTVGAGETSATITLHVSVDAPDTDFHVVTSFVIATPRSATAGRSARSTAFKTRVAADFELGIKGFGRAFPPIEAPDCATADVPIQISRDIAMKRGIALQLEDPARGPRGGGAGPPTEAVPNDLSPGLHAEILSSPLVSPGGGVVAERTLRLSVNWAEAGPRVLLALKATSIGGGSSTQTLALEIVRAKPTAQVVGSSNAAAPQRGRPGSDVTIEGNGFCPGTVVWVGSSYAGAQTQPSGDHRLDFSTPRYATNGTVTVVPSGDPHLAYQTKNEVRVDSFRNSAGFQFHNYSDGSLSFDEFREAFSADDFFVKVNLCWPFDCMVSTGAPDPVSVAEWVVMREFLSGGGHCFGMVYGSQELRSSAAQLLKRLPGVDPDGTARVFDASGQLEPAAAVRSFIDAEQVKQFSDEFLRAWFGREQGISAQLRTIEVELKHHRDVLVSLKKGGASDGHTVLAYDMTQTSTGAEIYVYNPNEEFIGDENSNPPWHFETVNDSVLHVDKINQTWRFDVGPSEPDGMWSGGGGGIWAIPAGTMPRDPSLPGADTLRSSLQSLIFGSAGGAVHPAGTNGGAAFLPASDGSGTGSAGSFVSSDARRSLDVTLEGRRAGSYAEAYTAAGFFAAATNVSTERGVRDRIAGHDDAITLDSGRDRPLELELARRFGPGLSTTATLRTHASAGGSETASLPTGNALTFAHRGAPTSLSFTLTSVRADGGPASFVSRPIAVRNGDRMRVVPLDAAMRRARISIHAADGTIRTRVIRSAGFAGERLRLGRPRLLRHRARVRIRLAGFHGRALLGAVLRLMRGHRVVASRAVSAKAANGTRVLTWRVPPHAKPGTYRLQADVRGLSTQPGSSVPGAVSAHRGASVHLPR
jgi:hypothetical protein